MKKLKYLLFVLLFIPCMVKADMAAPGLKPYKMVVTNPDGIDYYETDEFKKVEGHLNKNDKFTVTYEYDGAYSIDINKEDSYYLSSLDGTALIKDSVDPVKDKDGYIRTKKTAQEVVVYAKDGVDILEGPAEIYKKVGYAPKGTKLTFKYYTNGESLENEDDTEEIDEIITYIYVEYKGKKGWVNVLAKSILFPEKQDFIAREDVKISGTTIPKNTIIRSNYTFDNWSRSSLIEYNNCEDVVSKYDEESDLLLVNKYYAIAKKEFKVYSEANNKGTIVTTIPTKAKFMVIASYAQRGVDEEQNYVEYQGKRGWIKVENNEDEKEYSFVEEDIENSSLILTDKELKDDTKEEPVEDVAPPTKKEDKKKTTKKKADDYTLTYVIIGASVAIVALITIILVNKKSKNKKEVKATEPVQSTLEKPVVEETTPVEETTVESQSEDVNQNTTEVEENKEEQN